MTAYDRIESLEEAIRDAEETLKDGIYEAQFPATFAQIPAMIQDCRREIAAILAEARERSAVAGDPLRADVAAYAYENPELVD